ncbi:MAG: hypothetical protein ACI94Y_003994 [Maribacter sp.]|jgi:hypothetical protein
MKKSKEWFGVKIVYINRIEGEAKPELIDENFMPHFIAYEESVVVIRAKSFKKAYIKAGKIAKENENEYENRYGQKVITRYFDAIDCFQLFDEKLKNGTEVYSNIIESSTKLERRDFIKQMFPIKEGMYHMLLNDEFNGKKI